MPNIIPISDLTGGDALHDVAIGAPVFLTQNGRGRYAVLDIDEYREYEKLLAVRRLKAELDLGRQSGERDGWIPSDELWRRLGLGDE